MNANPVFTNALIKEQSPYLLQHAHNPVNWMPWSETIFELAKSQNKPILVSIGYAACHWCHVMERESFEDEQVAQYMNTHFINVKVDREERPDVDQVYMDALQAMTGSGGWPLNMFVLPDGRPFYGGTYFPPQQMHQRASWIEVLKGVQEAFQNNYEKLADQATNLTNHLVQTNIKNVQPSTINDAPLATEEDFELIIQRILQQADPQWGGFGNAPKFPQTYALQLLLKSYYHSKNEAALFHATRSIDKMIQGGIYDHVGGGFARYSTDKEWQAPHFEKMLYDNALLVTVISEAFQLTKKKEYATVIEETINFVCTELSGETPAFYAALDADSEGVEGKFYTWSLDEIKAIVAPEIFEAFCAYYQITAEGNWEHTNIIWTTDALEKGWTPAFIKAKKQLLSERSKRIRPSLDNKIILSWNCLMIIGLCKAYSALSNENYKNRATQVIAWLEKNMFNEKENYFYHTHTNGINKSIAFLEDYASLIQAYIQLHQITGETAYILNAKKWMQYVQSYFLDEEGLYFYFTSNEQTDLLVRKKDSYDGAIASSNAMICASLYFLGHMFEDAAWISQAEKMILGIRKTLVQYPSSFSYWGQIFYQMLVGITELVGVGPTVQKDLIVANNRFLPSFLLLFTKEMDANLPLTDNRQGIVNQYFICKNKTCSAPQDRIEHILALI